MVLCESDVDEVGTHCAFDSRLARYFYATCRNMESTHPVQKPYQRHNIRGDEFGSFHASNEDAIMYERKGKDV